MTDKQLALITELCRRYWCGWEPKEPGERRAPVFEQKVKEIVEGKNQL